MIVLAPTAVEHVRPEVIRRNNATCSRKSACQLLIQDPSSAMDAATRVASSLCLSAFAQPGEHHSNSS